MTARTPIKVSIVVTTFNQEDTIGKTLDSILAQKCDFPFEIQLSDDCSSDSTAEICSRYAEAHPDIIRFTRNNINRGCRDNYFDTLLRCNAPYIADCAGDDYWVDPDKLQKQADILDADPEISLVHTNWAYLDNATRQTRIAHDRIPDSPRPLISGKGELLLPVLQHNEKPFIHLCSSMYRKDIFTREYIADEHLFRCREFPCEDMQIKALYAHSGKIAYIPDVTFHYRIGQISVSSVEDYVKTFDFYFRALKLTIYLAEKYGIPQEKMNATYLRFASFLFAQAYFAHDKERISQLLDLMNDLHLKLPLKSRVLVPTTAIPFIWRICAVIKHAVSSVTGKSTK